MTPSFILSGQFDFTAKIVVPIVFKRACFASLNASCWALGVLFVTSAAVAREAGVIDPTKPLRIVAVEVVADERQAVTTYTGNVQMLQSHATLLGDRVLVHLEGSAGERYEAYGEPARVEYLRSSEGDLLIGRALEMRYDLATGRLDLIRQATLDRADDHLEGDRIAYYVPTDRAVVLGVGESGTRVRATYRPVAR